MKSGLAAMTFALEAIIQSKIKLRGMSFLNILWMKRLRKRHVACHYRGYKADAGICCESQQPFHIQPACIGESGLKSGSEGNRQGYRGAGKELTRLRKVML